MKKLRTRTSKNSGDFWNNEYLKENHLSLSDRPSEDLDKFINWLERKTGRAFLNPIASALDLGCGNGRNLILLSQNFGMRGIGIDISKEAIKIANRSKNILPLSFEVGSIGKPLSIKDSSQTLVLDMMTFHFLNKIERENLLSEIYRVLKPNGWFFLKTFLLDEDVNAKNLISEFGTEEAGTYIHPKIGVAEHVFTENEITDLLSPFFNIHKILKSHKHIKDGRPWKRRSMSIYAEKKN